MAASRFDRLKIKITNFLMENNPSYAPIGLAHLAYSACIGAILARKRGLDMDMAQTAGILHDVWLHLHAPYNDETVKLHAHEGAVMAADFMRDMGEYTEEEICTVVTMIENHDFTAQTDDPMSEIMKDADMLSHYLNASAAGSEDQFNPRAAKTLYELISKDQME